tara:strand:+ start:53 stop:313 length:261 start_codon:yes stop_codon:yes gene_type:complete
MINKGSRIHKELRFPYHIEVPSTEDESEWTIYKIKDREDEKQLKKIYPEFFEKGKWVKQQYLAMGFIHYFHKVRTMTTDADATLNK